jgi:hypothetical protein
VATREITMVSTHQPTDHRYEHIHRVELDGSVFNRISIEDVIRNLESVSGDRYYTLGGGQRARVYQRDCPECSHPKHITTTPDGTTSNNLLKLPRF